jgi:hypothetical protein
VCSVPPLVGFTTLISVCGFAWGIKGFLLACPATFLGAAFSFLLLRFVFKSRLKRLSETNDRWRALEEVVVSCFALALRNVVLICKNIGSKGLASDYSHSVFTRASVGVQQCPLCFYQKCSVLAIYGRYHVGLVSTHSGLVLTYTPQIHPTQGPTLRIRCLANRRACRPRPAGQDGYSHESN